MRLIEVTWLDSGTFYGEKWENPSDIPHLVGTRLSLVKTVGSLVHEDEEAIYVGLSHTFPEDESTGVYGVQTIAKSNIRSVHELAFFKNITEECRGS